MSKKIMILLGVSLALNFAFVGFETARAIYRPYFHPMKRLAFRPDMPPHHMGDRSDMPRMADDRPEMSAHGKEMKKVFTQAIKQNHEEMQAAKMSIVAALKAENLDREALRQALNKGAAVRRNIDEIIQADMLDVIVKMSPEERARFAEKFEQAPKFKEMRHKKMSSKDRRPGEMRNKEGKRMNADRMNKCKC